MKVIKIKQKVVRQRNTSKNVLVIKIIIDSNSLLSISETIAFTEKLQQL